MAKQPSTKLDELENFKKKRLISRINYMYIQPSYLELWELKVPSKAMFDRWRWDIQMEVETDNLGTDKYVTPVLTCGI